MKRKRFAIGEAVRIVDRHTNAVIGIGYVIAYGQSVNGYEYRANIPGDKDYCSPAYEFRRRDLPAKKPVPKRYWLEINPYAKTLGGLGWKRHMSYAARREASAECKRLLTAFGRGYARVVPEY